MLAGKIIQDVYKRQGVKRTKNGISEYGEHAADDVSVGCSRISGEKKEYHWRDRTQRHGQFLSVCYTAV